MKNIVLHITDNLKLGGAQVVLRDIVQNLPPSKYDSVVYSLRKNPLIQPAAQNLTLLNTRHKNYNPLKLLEFARICKKHKPCIIHAHLHKAIILALLTAPFTNAEIVIHEHGSIKQKGPQYALYRLLLRILKNNADLYIAVSDYMKAQLINKSAVPPEKIKVIPNPIDLEKFNPDLHRRTAPRNQFNLTEKHILLGLLGRLNTVKAPDLAIKALKELLTQNPNYKLILIGTGPEQNNLKTLAKKLNIEKNIIFAGYCPNPQKIIPAIDIALIPSIHEALSNACLEFMAMKIPIISSGTGGLAELITHNETALITPQNTPHQIALAVQTLTENPHLKNKLIENAAQKVKSYSIKNYIKTITETYSNLHPQSANSD